MIKILLDTDIGGDIDDAVCLAYLLREPCCQLLGIATVCGEPEKRAAVADAICQAAGRRVTIVAGMDETLQPVPVYPVPEGAGKLKNWPHRDFMKGDAPGVFYQLIKENAHEVILVGIGNMTNIAALFRRYPDALGLLKGLYTMNGYFGAEPLPAPTYNWNSWADPMASQEVFAAQAAVHRVIPLEVTDQLTIQAGAAQRLFPTKDRLLNAVMDFGNAWLKSTGRLTLHDPLAAVSIFYPDICVFKRGRVQAETENEESMGGTAFTPDHRGNVEVACKVDRTRFYQVLEKSFSVE